VTKKEELDAGKRGGWNGRGEGRKVKVRMRRGEEEKEWKEKRG